MYKDLVTVVKETDTGAMKVVSHALKVEAVEGLATLWPTKEHPQNWLYLTVDPVHWHVRVFYHQWTNQW